MTKEQTDNERGELVSVKISKSVVEEVKKNKKNTYMPIGVFFEKAAMEKLNKKKKSQ